MTPIEKIANKCIIELRKIKETMSGDDSGLENLWDEICAQVQDEYSFFWDVYEDMIDGTIQTILSEANNELDELDELEVKQEVLRVASDYSNARIRKHIESRYC